MRSSVNKLATAFARESSIGTLPGSPTWYRLAPNTIPRFGSKLRTIAPRPISRDRQLGKPVVVDLDSGLELEHYITPQLMLDMAELYAFAEAANANASFRNLPAVGGGTPGFTIPAATANQAAKFQWHTTGKKTLIYARGYATSGNNGLKTLSADLASTDTTLQVAGITAETPPTNATVELAGIRAKTADLAITVSGSTATLTSGNGGVGGAETIDFTTIGIFVGQMIHVGGLAAGQQFSAGKGFARVVSIAAASVSLDKIDSGLATDSGAGDTVDLLFGRFVRNVSSDANSDDNRYLEASLQFELALADLGGAGTDEYEYAKGNYKSSMRLQLPLTDIAKATLAFIGTDTTVPSTSRATNAASPILPLLSNPNSTAINVARLRNSLLSAANTGFTNFEVTINNNVKPSKVIGTLGAQQMNVGILAVEVSATALFTDHAIIDALRNSTTVTLDTIMRNQDASGNYVAVAVDLPSLVFGDGERSFPLDEAVLISLRGESFRDATFGTSIGVSFFPVVP